MQTAATPTDAGLLLSLAAGLPDPSSPLARRARRLAGRLETNGASARAVRREAADLLAELLTAADADLSGFDLGDDLLSPDFDD